jgi:hypothetical protein
MSRGEYKEFSYVFFCKHVYEVRSKQLARPCWQTKRNKNARELHHLETDKMRKKWAYGDDMEKMIDMFKQGRICDRA